MHRCRSKLVDVFYASFHFIVVLIGVQERSKYDQSEADAREEKEDARIVLEMILGGKQGHRQCYR